MLQFFTDFQLKSLLDVTPFRPADGDVQSLFNPLPTHITHYYGDKPDEYAVIPYYEYFTGDRGRSGSGVMTAEDIYHMDQWYVHPEDWVHIWKNITEMRETGIREILKCIEADRNLLIALDYSDFNQGKLKVEGELVTKLFLRRSYRRMKEARKA